MGNPEARSTNTFYIEGSLASKQITGQGSCAIIAFTQARGNKKEVFESSALRDQLFKLPKNQLI